MNKLKKPVNFFLRIFNLQLVNRTAYQKLKDEGNNYLAYSLYNICDQKYPDFFKYVNFSQSQLKQDLFVLSELAFKKKGFFVEFGASDGIRFSNTYLMEKKLEWSGILCEPAKIWHSRLKANRLVPIDTGCVWSDSGKTLIFNEVVGNEQQGELSTIDSYSNNDYMSKFRKKNSKKYHVSTISLSDLLK